VKREVDILRRLYRMNVTRAVLFPGLDGYAECRQTFVIWANLFQRDTDYARFVAKGR
jgi:hypothetical protein